MSAQQPPQAPDSNIHKNSEQLKFQQTQETFTQHIRNPEKHSSPDGIESRRMKIYTELFYNNIEGFIRKGFPVLRALYQDLAWHQLVRDFYEYHHCHSPYFLDISKEFVDYLQNERDISKDPAFIIELAHYEWVELALDISMEELPSSGFNPEGDLLSTQVYLSPLAWPLQYQWPVHRISPDFIPKEIEQSHFLIVYRTADFEIKFMEVNAITARLISIIQQNDELTGAEAITQIHHEAPNIALEQLTKGGAEALNHLREVGIVLGSRLQSV